MTGKPFGIVRREHGSLIVAVKRSKRQKWCIRSKVSRQVFAGRHLVESADRGYDESTFQQKVPNPNAFIGSRGHSDQLGFVSAGCSQGLEFGVPRDEGTKQEVATTGDRTTVLLVGGSIRTIGHTDNGVGVFLVGRVPRLVVIAIVRIRHREVSTDRVDYNMLSWRIGRWQRREHALVD